MERRQGIEFKFKVCNIFKLKGTGSKKDSFSQEWHQVTRKTEERSCIERRRTSLGQWLCVCTLNEGKKEEA